jgi:hypothetical protein
MERNPQDGIREMMWHFFVMACMANAPADCATVILDTPRVGAAIAAGGHPTSPPAFHNRDRCLQQMGRITGLLPFRVMGSVWVQYGCVRA